MNPKAQCDETYDPAPADAVHFTHHLIEFAPHLIQAAEAFIDGVLEGAVLQNTAVSLILRRRRSKIQPKERVIDMTCLWR